MVSHFRLPRFSSSAGGLVSPIDFLSADIPKASLVPLMVHLPSTMVSGLYPGQQSKNRRISTERSRTSTYSCINSSGVAFTRRTAGGTLPRSKKCTIIIKISDGEQCEQWHAQEVEKNQGRVVKCICCDTYMVEILKVHRIEKWEKKTNPAHIRAEKESTNKTRKNGGIKYEGANDKGRRKRRERKRMTNACTAA